MKLAWFLIGLGILLIVDGTLRVILGVMDSNIILAAGGIATGWLLGVWVLRKGLGRKRLKEEASNG